jgi:two-component system, chemotaxis family, chemotaxis protein CheY
MKKTILVVDDYGSIRNFICEILEKKGYATMGAANGNQAYELLLEKPDTVNLVLTDYNMPECTGFELLQKIRTNPGVSAIPVVMLTTESNPDKMREAKEAGLNAWIRKPYRSETFFSQIENALLSNA